MTKTNGSEVQAFDFSAFSQLDVQEAGYDMPVLKPNGEPSGMVIRLAGPNSQRRVKARHARLDTALQKNGRIIINAEQAETQLVDDAVVATIGWSFPDGFKGPEFNEKNVRDIYERHADILLQVRNQMDNLRNFTQASQKA